MARPRRSLAGLIHRILLILVRGRHSGDAQWYPASKAIRFGADMLFWLEGVGGFDTAFGWRRQRRGAYGPVAAKRPASNLKRPASGHAVGSQTRMRAAPSMTRAAILSRRRRKVWNSAFAAADRFGAAARRVWSSQ